MRFQFQSEKQATSATAGDAGVVNRVQLTQKNSTDIFGVRHQIILFNDIQSGRSGGAAYWIATKGVEIAKGVAKFSHDGPVCDHCCNRMPIGHWFAQCHNIR